MSPRKFEDEELERLFQLSLEMRRKRPKFRRQESWRYKRLEDSGWRRPRGISSRMRREFKGWPPRVKVGYRGPKLVRGLHPSGYVEVLVSNPKELEGLDPRVHAVRIRSSVGKRKRMEIIKRADELGLKVLNRRV